MIKVKYRRKKNNKVKMWILKVIKAQFYKKKSIPPTPSISSFPARVRKPDYWIPHDTDNKGKWELKARLFFIWGFSTKTLEIMAIK